MTPVIRRYLEISARTRTISTLADRRNPLAESMPSSQATSRAGLRRSLSMDALDDLKGPKLDHRIQVHQPETKVVPVRRAPKVAVTMKTSSSEQSVPVPKVPTLSRAISMANLRSKMETQISEPITTQPEVKGARRVVQPVVATTSTAPPPAIRSGPSRPIHIAPPTTEIKEVARNVPSPTESASTSSTNVVASAPQSKGGGERRGNGAQRVAIPPPPNPPVLAQKVEKDEDVEKKSTSSGPARTAKPVIDKSKSFRPQPRTGRAEVRPPAEASTKMPAREPSVPRSEHTSKDSRPASRADSNRPNSRMQSRFPPTKIKSSQTGPPKPTLLKETKSSQPKLTEVSKESRPAPVRRGLTAPTRAQLERAKVLEGERDKTKATSSSTRGTNSSKRGFVPSRGRGIPRGVGPRTAVARATIEESIPEAQVPLPTSPKLAALENKVDSDEIESPPELELPKSEAQAQIAETNLEDESERGPQGSPPISSAVTEHQVEPQKEEDLISVISESKAPPEEVQKSAQQMSEMDLLLFSSPMKTFAFNPPLASSPFDLERSQQGKVASTSDSVAPQPDQLDEDEQSRLEMVSPSKTNDPYGSLTFFVQEALAAPMPQTPDLRPSPFIRFEADSTLSYATIRKGEDDFETDATMDKLEFAVNGVDQFGRIIQSPSKASKQILVAPRDALVDLSVNQ